MLQWGERRLSLWHGSRLLSRLRLLLLNLTLRVQVFSKFLTKAECGRVQLKPGDAIREMIAKLPGCGGDDIIDTFDFRKPDFAAARVKKVVFLP